jgi:DNA-binding transcriptional LysR family regulator
MRTDPHRLLVLRALRRTGSIQAAATALHLTPSGVSQHLSRLESETGLTLLDRTRRGGGRPIQLTPAGLALAERADTVATALAEAGRETDRLRGESTGTVRVGGFATALGQFVVPVLARLAISDPALQPQVFETTAADGLAQLRAGQLDLLISDRRLDTAGTYPGLNEHNLSRDHYRVVVPQIWPPAQRLEQLLTGPWITSPPPEPPRRMLDQLCTRYGMTSGTQHVCTESRTMLALVAAGLGAAIVPDLTLAHQPHPGIGVHPTTDEVGSRLLTLLSLEHASSAARRFQTLVLQVASTRG